MSIIYEALKKMQGASAAPPPAPAGAPASLKPHPPKSSLKKQTSITFIGIALGILLSWMSMHKLTISSPTQKTAQPKTTQPLRIPSPPPSTAAPAPSNTPDTQTSRQQMPEFLLNGIVLSEEGNLALINDQITKVGDEIEGAKIEEITNTQVVLDFKNQKILLKNK